jgi:hypothetical protein
MFLFTSHTYGMIVRKLQVRQKAGVVVRRRGVRCSFAIIDQPTLKGERIAWTATIAGERYKGISGTVRDAATEIENLVRRPA